MHRACAGRVIDHDPAVHLLVVDVDPAAAEADLRRLVGRAVEALGERAGDVGRRRPARPRDGPARRRARPGRPGSPRAPRGRRPGSRSGHSSGRSGGRRSCTRGSRTYPPISRMRSRILGRSSESTMWPRTSISSTTPDGGPAAGRGARIVLVLAHGAPSLPAPDRRWTGPPSRSRPDLNAPRCPCPPACRARTSSRPPRSPGSAGSAAGPAGRWRTGYRRRAGSPPC